jgi:F-type H+-transporting ATPase subunit gamma
MPSLHEIRRKIKSVKNTQQITRAMKMVATARLRRAQGQALAARPFAQRIEELIQDLASRLQVSQPEEAPLHPLFLNRSSNEETMVIVTSDKGLCGSFNTTVIRRSLELLKEKKEMGKTVHLFLVGRKGRDFFRRLYPVTKEYVNIFSRLNSTQAGLIGTDLIGHYLEKPISKVTVVYQTFVSVIQQKLMVETLLPLPPIGGEGRVRGVAIDYLYEPRKEEILSALLPRSLKARIYHILLESYAAELGARMNAMENATKNAKELMDILTLRANKTRQTMITKELSELVGCAEALS